MSNSISPTVPASRVRHLLDERQQHEAAIQKIDKTLADISALPGLFGGSPLRLEGLALLAVEDRTGLDGRFPSRLGGEHFLGFGFGKLPGGGFADVGAVFDPASMSILGHGTSF